MKITIAAITDNTLGGGIATLINAIDPFLKQEHELKKIALMVNPNCKTKDWKILTKKQYLHTRNIVEIHKIISNFLIYISFKNKRNFQNYTEKSDLIICTDPFTIPFLPKQPYNVLQLHASLQTFSFYKILVIMFLFFYKNKINRITILDEKDEQRLKKYCNDIKMAKNFTNLKEQNIYWEEKNKKLVYFGLLAKYKNITSIMEMANKEKFSIDFYGPIIDYKQEELEKHQSQFVTIRPGYYDMAKMTKTFAKYNGLILNSVIEGEPIAILEALQLSLCVITPRHLDNLTNYLEGNVVYFDEINKIKLINSDQDFYLKTLKEQRTILVDRTIEAYLVSHNITTQQRK